MATRRKTIAGTTAVGFKYCVDKTIDDIGVSNLIPTDSNNLAGKIIFTANGIIIDGYLVAEPNGALESSFAQAVRNIDSNTLFKGAVVKGYANSTVTNTPATLYTDNTSTTAITPNANMLYYEPSFNALFVWVSDMKCYCSVSDVYKAVLSKVSSEYYPRTRTYSSTEVDSMIATLGNFGYKVVDALPDASASTTDAIYMVQAAEGAASYTQYYTIKNDDGTYSWKTLGTTTLDLTNYATKDEAVLASKVKYLTEDEYDKLVADNMVEEDVQYNIYEE